METPVNGSYLYSYEYLYQYTRQHAEKYELANTIIALTFMQKMLDGEQIKQETCKHSLMMCRYMIDLNMDLSKEEGDILLASTICHIFPEEHIYEHLDEVFIQDYHLDPEIVHITKLVYKMETADECELESCYQAIQAHKLALLLTIADRGNVVEQLFGMNSWQVRKFIYETRAYYIPLCIYAKEHYHELLSPIGMLTEKLRNLTDVSEILMVRFEERETELEHEILAIREENATIRGILNNLQ